jgi:Flp pilus assembly protein TadB
MRRGWLVVAGLIILAVVIPALWAPLMRYLAIPIVIVLLMVVIFNMFRRRRPKEPTELL